MSSKHRNNNSICEKSMNMVVNIIRLSSFSIATMSLGSPSPPVISKRLVSVAAGSVAAAKEPLMTQIPGSRRSQESHGSSKPISFVMQPDEGNGSSRVIHKDQNSCIDERASDFIRRVHEKNRNDALEASKHSPHIPPPPPRAVK